jgi:hypothetical protein
MSTKKATIQPEWVALKNAIYESKDTDNSGSLPKVAEVTQAKHLPAFYYAREMQVLLDQSLKVLEASAPFTMTTDQIKDLYGEDAKPQLKQFAKLTGDLLGVINALHDMQKSIRTGYLFPADMGGV